MTYATKITHSENLLFARSGPFSHILSQYLANQIESNSLWSLFSYPVTVFSQSDESNSLRRSSEILKVPTKLLRGKATRTSILAAYPLLSIFSALEDMKSPI
jgi:hypothetical protein